MQASSLVGMPSRPPDPPAPAPAELRPGIAAWADWYARAGVIDSVAESGTDRYRRVSPDPPPLSVPRAAPSRPSETTIGIATGAPANRPRRAPSPSSGGSAAPGSGAERVASARQLAAGCRSLAELEEALQRFDGCALKDTASRLCFADGSPSARLMLIGEAPGAEEDRLGRPFVGPSGQLLDRMLAAIGLDRRAVWITNIIFWRPPGNRTPTTTEVAICQPFLERQIELLRPGLILFLGGSAARALLEVTDGVTKLRGRRFLYRPTGDGAAPIPALVTFHPAYLLRQPLQKRLAWRDMLMLQIDLESLTAASSHP
jgi:DNA polymerase